MRSFIIMIGSLTSMVGGCASSSVGVISRPCLRGPVPHVGRPVPDEVFALMRRELDRAELSPPLVRARMLERLPLLFPDVSDILGEPSCVEELRARVRIDPTTRPLVYSRDLLVRMRLGQDRSVLRMLARLDDSGLTDYQLSSGESGAPPPKALVRLIALSDLARSWPPDELVIDRLLHATDPRERLVVQPMASAWFDSKAAGNPAAAAVLRAILRDVPGRLRSMPDRVALELVVGALTDLGYYARRLGLVDEARAVVMMIVDARGEFSLTHGIAGAARDLHAAGRRAAFELDAPQSGLYRNQGLPAERIPFDPLADWLDLEPAHPQIAPADAATRVAELDSELARLQFSRTRCLVLNELSRWLLPEEGDRHFDQITTPFADLDRSNVPFSEESLCRIHAAFAFPGVAATKRAALLLRLLSVTDDEIDAYGSRLDEKGPGLVADPRKSRVRLAAAAALGKHPEWIDDSPALRAWVAAAARTSALFSGDLNADREWIELQPAFERLLASADVEGGRAILAAWGDSVRALDGKKVTNIAPGEVALARLFTIARTADRFGFRAQAKNLFADLAHTKLAEVAALARELLGD
jgi:hypothetical protein